VEASCPAGFTVAPIIEVSSGRPFNVITGTDTRLDLGASEARPSLVSSGTTSPYISGAAFGVADVCLANDGSTFSVPFLTPPADATAASAATVSLRQGSSNST